MTCSGSTSGLPIEQAAQIPSDLKPRCQEDTEASFVSARRGERTFEMGCLRRVRLIRGLNSRYSRYQRISLHSRMRLKQCRCQNALCVVSTSNHPPNAEAEKKAEAEEEKVKAKAKKAKAKAKAQKAKAKARQLHLLWAG